MDGLVRLIAKGPRGIDTGDHKGRHYDAMVGYGS